MISARRPAIVLAVILAAFAGLAFALFGHLFLMIEYREWADARNLSYIFGIFSLKGIAFSRSFGMFTDASLALFFGHNAVAHNAAQISIIAISGLLLFLTLRRMAPKVPVTFSAACVVFVLFSTSVMDALCWQATILDKLCLMFTALGTYYVMRINARGSWLSVASVNVLLLAIVIAAYNSKESSFALAPSMLALLAIRLSSVRRVLVYSIAPLTYAVLAVGIVLYNRLFVDVVEKSHEFGGNVIFNLYHFAVYLFNAEPLVRALGVWPYADMSILMGFLVCAIVAIFGCAFAVTRCAGRPVSVLWLWASVSFVAAFSISLFAAGIPPYYMLVPQFYLSITIFLTAVVIWERWPDARLQCSYGTASIVALYVAGLVGSSAPYLHVRTLSDNFTAALAQVHARDHVTFLYPTSVPNAYMFLQSGIPTGLMPRIATKSESAYTGAPPNPSPRPDRTFVVLGSSLQLERIVKPTGGSSGTEPVGLR